MRVRRDFTSAALTEDVTARGGQSGRQAKRVSVSSHKSVSVVINAFNYGRFLSRAIESALHQETPDLPVEVVVVDDESNDETPEVAASYMGRIHYHRKPNGGQASAIATGLGLATGDFICLLDADDEFGVGKAGNVVAAFERCPQLGAVYNSYIKVDAHGTPFGEPATWPRAGKNPRQYGLFWMAGGVPTSCISMRREIARRLVLPEEFRICADTYILQALPQLTEIGWITNPLTSYRIHGNNAFAGQDARRQRKLMLENWRAIHSTLSKAYGIELSKAVFEIQEQRTKAASWHKIASTCFSGLRYIARAEASPVLKARETAKLLATALGLHKPLPI